MYKKIYKAIKNYDKIVIARHIGVDPDALASQLALRDSIKLTFPEKKVYTIGNLTSKFSYIGKYEKIDSPLEHVLLIVLDTPDKKRVDGLDGVVSYDYSIKIDHHPFIESFCDIEYIDDTASSTCELILEMLNNTKLKMDKNIAEKLFIGLVSDTNRFAFKSSTSKTFKIVAELLEQYDLNIEELYRNLYMRPLNEVRLQGYIEQNMTVTENGVGYIELNNDVITRFKADVGSAGNMVNNFNYIDEVLVWVMITEDKKNDMFKLNIRSRGPEINQVAERHNGGGHKFASGARVTSLEEAKILVSELDEATKEYIENLSR